MMLEELFTAARDDLRNKYTQQVNHIIRTTISQCPQLKYQTGCFELLGYDFLLDNTGRLYLMEINLNPACQAERHP